MKKTGKFFILLMLLSCLFSCSSSKKNEKANESQSLYDLPETVDYQKAAKLNIELGLSYLSQEQISRARSKLNRAKKLAPNLPEVHYAYAYFLEHVGEIKDAENSYQKAISLHPKGGKEHNNYGAFLCRQNQYRQAEKEFMLALEDPNYVNTGEALENAGMCVLQVPDVAKATEYFEKSLRHDPNRPNALLELAILSFKEHKLLQAKDYHKRFMQVAKPNARSLLLGKELAKIAGDKTTLSRYQQLLNSEFPKATIADLYQPKAIT